MEETSQEDDQAMEIYHKRESVSIQMHCIFAPVENHATDDGIESEHERSAQECRLHLPGMRGDGHNGGPSHVLINRVAKTC